MELAIALLHFKIEKYVAECLAPPSAFEDLHWLQRRHEQLNGARFIHFLPDNFRHFAHRSIAQRQPGVRSGHQLSDQSGAQHQLMTRHFSVRRNFFHRRDKCLRPAHGIPLESKEDSGSRIQDSGYNIGRTNHACQWHGAGRRCFSDSSRVCAAPAEHTSPSYKYGALRSASRTLQFELQKRTDVVGDLCHFEFKIRVSRDMKGLSSFDIMPLRFA